MSVHWDEKQVEVFAVVCQEFARCRAIVFPATTQTTKGTWTQILCGLLKRFHCEWLQLVKTLKSVDKREEEWNRAWSNIYNGSMSFFSCGLDVPSFSCYMWMWIEKKIYKAPLWTKKWHLVFKTHRKAEGPTEKRGRDVLEWTPHIWCVERKTPVWKAKTLASVNGSYFSFLELETRFWRT